MERRAVLAGAAVAGAASVAAVLMLRKPQPELYAPVARADEPSPLQGIGALTAVTPVRAAPDIAFSDAQGGVHHVSQFVGRGVVLNFWATWCVPCVRELPSLAALAAHAGGMTVLPISQDRGGASIVAAYFAAHGIRDLGVWCDPDGAAGRAMGIRGVPTTFVIDRQGRITGLLEGSADWGSDAALARLRTLTA